MSPAQCRVSPVLSSSGSSDGRVSPPATSVSGLSECLPVRRTDGSIPAARSTLDSTSSSVQLSPAPTRSATFMGISGVSPRGPHICGQTNARHRRPASFWRSKSLEQRTQKSSGCSMCREAVGLPGVPCRDVRGTALQGPQLCWRLPAKAAGRTSHCWQKVRENEVLLEDKIP